MVKTKKPEDKKTEKTKKQSDPNNGVSKVRSDTLQSLKNLRVLVHEISENWSNRVQADLAALIEDLENFPELRMSKTDVQILRKVIEAAELKDLKPEKGRSRDIRALNEQVKLIRQIFEKLDK